MPVTLRSGITASKLPAPYDLLQTLRDLANGVNAAEVRQTTFSQQITNLGDQVSTVINTPTTPPPSVGPFPSVVVGIALSGDGSALSPIDVLVDNVTVIVNGSNQLEAVIPPDVLTGTLTPTRVPYASAANVLSDDPLLRWDVPNSRLFAPTIVGGTGVTDDLILQSTSGVGTIDSRIFFKVGNNGAVIACEMQLDTGGTLGRLGIGTPGNLTVSYPLTVFGSGADIGFLAHFRGVAGTSAYLQCQTGAGANEQAGFSFSQITNTVEWRMAVIGNDGDAMRWQVITGGGAVTTTVGYFTKTFNLILDSTRSDPAAGSKVLVIGDGTVPSGLASNTAAFYANDVGGTVEMFAINEAGESTQLTGAALTNPRIPFMGTAGVLDDDPAMKWDDTNKTLVLATGGQTLDAAPGTEKPQIHAGGDFAGVDNGQGAWILDGYGAQPLFTMRRANGTQASKSALADTNIIFNFRSYGWDGSDYGLGGLMRMIANGAWTGSNHGEDFVVLLTANGSVASPAERFRVTGRSIVLIGAASEPTTGTIGLFFADGTVPATLASNTAGLYANDVGGTVNMFAINEAGESNQLSGDIKIASGKFFITQAAAFMIKGVTAWTNGAGALGGTLLNAPAAGNPTKWIPVDDNGVTRYIPAW